MQDTTKTLDAEILILEDETLIALDIEATLREAGYARLHVSTDADEADRYLDAATPGVALLDVNLGRGRTSFDLGKRLRSRGCPIVFMSGYSTAEAALPSSLSDAPCLPKPFSNPQLIAAIAASQAP